MITIMKYGNVLIKSKKPNGDSFDLVAEYLPDNTDFSKNV